MVIEISYPKRFKLETNGLQLAVNLNEAYTTVFNVEESDEVPIDIDCSITFYIENMISPCFAI